MGAKRRRIEAALKAKAAVRGERTKSERVGQFGVHPTQIGQRKRQLLDSATELFSDDQDRKVENQDALIAELYEQIGRLQMKEQKGSELFLLPVLSRAVLHHDCEALSLQPIRPNQYTAPSYGPLAGWTGGCPAERTEFAACGQVCWGGEGNWALRCRSAPGGVAYLPIVAGVGRNATIRFWIAVPHSSFLIPHSPLLLPPCLAPLAPNAGIPIMTRVP